MSKFHLSDGLYFERQKDGDVKIIQTKDGGEVAADESNVDFTILINANTWCSVVYAMSDNIALNYQDVEKMHGILKD